MKALIGKNLWSEGLKYTVQSTAKNDSVRSGLSTLLIITLQGEDGTVKTITNMCRHVFTSRCVFMHLGIKWSTVEEWKDT